MAHRSTKVDDQFRKKVAEEFTRARDRAKASNVSVEQFVSKLGITRAALHKYLHRKAIPSLRVLERAKRFFGVDIPYGDLGESYVQTHRADSRQMEFQFALSDISPEQIRVKKFTPKGESSAELIITIDFRKTA
jgi:transcriptional regulator with XRE-family HTH domain